MPAEGGQTGLWSAVIHHRFPGPRQGISKWFSGELSRCLPRAKSTGKAAINRRTPKPPALRRWHLGLGVVSWFMRDLGTRSGTGKCTFAPPKVDRGPWETYIEAESIGMSTARQCVSNVIRFEEEPSPTEEKE